MKLYVCYGTMPPSGHPCRRAFEALKAAGHQPEVIRSYGWQLLPEFMNRAEGRRLAREHTGTNSVPLLQTDDGEFIGESKKIIAWARANPKTEGDVRFAPSALRERIKTKLAVIKYSTALVRNANLKTAKNVAAAGAARPVLPCKIASSAMSSITSNAAPTTANTQIHDPSQANC